MIGQRLFILIVFVSCCACSLQSQTSKVDEAEAKGSASVTAIKPAESVLAAEALFEARKFREAVETYEALVAQDPKSIPARVGLVRSYIKSGEIKRALDFATESRAAYPDSSDLKVAMGQVLFRRGEIAAAEKMFTSAWLNDDNNVQAMLELARIYKAMSLHKRAYSMVKAAYDIAPNDPEVASAWEITIPHAERIKLIERWLEQAKIKSPDKVDAIKRHLEAVKTLEGETKHRCELVSKLDRAEMELRPLGGDVRRMGLEVTVNSKKTKLLLDTGASGITISPSEAEDAGVKKLSWVYSAGVGGNKPVPGYLGYADSIEIGGLQFRDCTVTVMERRGGGSVIGADLFPNYLVGIDFPGKKLKLEPLPKRPDTSDSVAPRDKAAVTTSATEEFPRDRYIAPEMSTWTPVYRFGSKLLIPTKVNGGAPRLFLIDTGASSTILSTEFAREITMVARDQSMIVRGATGKIDKVYQANSATLEFGRLKQRNESVVSIDLSWTGFDAGVEISGLLGYSALGLLEVKIDYRDGLVDFVYDPKRIPQEGWRK